MHSIVHCHRAWSSTTIHNEMALNADIVNTLEREGAFRAATPFRVGFQMCHDELSRRHYLTTGEDYGQWSNRCEGWVKG